MRAILGELSTAYVVAAGLFGGAALLATDAPAGAQFHNWVRLIETRLAAPQSVTLAFQPLILPLRGSEQDITPSASAGPHIIPSQKAKDPLVMEYAQAHTLLQPVSIVPPRADDVLDERVRTETVSVTPPRTFADMLDQRVRAERISVTPKRTQADARQARDEEIAYVADHLRGNLTSELYADFDLFLYVSKAARGPLAQRMFVFVKDRSGEGDSGLSLLHTWPVSTGRETVERDKRGVRESTGTPAGYYQLDPSRFYRRYRSMQWGMSMPNSMFFDWVNHGARTGLAIHGVSAADEIAMLGQRASAGCVHLSPEASQILFNLIQRDYRGEVPRFAYNEKTDTISNKGTLARTKRGHVRMTDGYRALVVIEDFGGEEQVAELYMDGADQGG